MEIELKFREIVPTLNRMKGEKSVNPQRLRAVYDAIAVFYYCPPQVKDFVFIKAINGHEPTPGKSDAAMYYLDYQIGDSAIVKHGGKRQGIKLGQPGVKIIEAIASKLKKIQPESSDITPEVLGLSVEWRERLEAVMEETGQTDLRAMVCELIKQEIKFREGMRSRHQGKDFSSIERRERWYINANSIHKLVGGRFSIITPWCDRHNDEIESHNQTYELSEGDNRKSVNINEVVIVPEMPC